METPMDKPMNPDAWNIQQSLNRYTLGASTGDWDLVLSTFVENGVWEVPARGLCIEGQIAIRAAMRGFADRFAYFVQTNAPGVIAVDGNAATARSTIRECGRYKDQSRALEVLGVYEDVLERSGSDWKFLRRRFVALGAHSFDLHPDG